MQIILMSGVPGSGKSHYVSKLVNPLVCSADHYFMHNDKYVFNRNELGNAHGACLRKYTEALVHGEPLIVVDNTNVSAMELAPYIALAQAFKADCELVTVYCDIHVAFSRNTHRVPFASIQRMDKSLRERVLPPYWNVKLVTVNA